MKNRVIILSVILFCAVTLITSTANGQSVDSPSPMPEIWVSSAPGAPDMIDMLSEYDNPRFNWSKSRQYVYGFGFNGGSLTIPPFPLSVNNSYNALTRVNAFWIVHRRFKMKMAIEVGAIKPFNCFNRNGNQGLEQAANGAVDMGLKLYEAGGVLYSFNIDTSLGPCGYRPRDAGYLVGWWSVQVEDRLNKKLAEMKLANPNLELAPIKFRDIEPYPYNSPQKHIEYIDALIAYRKKMERSNFDAYYIDIDNRSVSDSDLVRDINFLIDAIHQRGIRVGLIINGEDPQSLAENNDLFYLTSANQRMARFKRLGLLERIDIVWVTSWAERFRANKNEPERRDFPFNVPEDALTLTNFLIHAKNCLKNLTDCNIYPELD